MLTQPRTWRIGTKATTATAFRPFLCTPAYGDCASTTTPLGVPAGRLPLIGSMAAALAGWPIGMKTLSTVGPIAVVTATAPTRLRNPRRVMSVIGPLPDSSVPSVPSVDEELGRHQR